MTTTQPLALLLMAGTSLTLAGLPASAAPTATGGYTVTPFGSAPAGASNPDSIVVDGPNVFIGYANTASKTGDPALGDSTIAEYNYSGSLLQTFSVVGHNDGLRVDPRTGLLWSMQDEDGSPNLAIINTVSGAKTTYQLNAVNGGGFDDINFQNGTTYISASNGAADTYPVIVKATQTGSNFSFTPIVNGNVIPTGGTAPLSLIDADSLTTIPGTTSLLLTDQTANELVTVGSPGLSSQTVSFVPTTDNHGNSVAVDDTIFPGGQSGKLLASDTNTGAVYAISGDFSGLAYSAVPDPGFVGSLDMGTGSVTPIVTGINVKGMAFLPDAATAVPESGSLALLSGGLALFLGGFCRKIVRHRVS